MKITIEFTTWAEVDAFRKSANQPNKTLLRDGGLSDRTVAVLREMGATYMEDCSDLTDHELLMKPNLGRKALSEIRAWKSPEPS